MSITAVALLLALGQFDDAPKLSDSERGLLQHAREELKAKVPARRIAAAEALGEIGPKMRDAVPELWEALLDPNAKVRAAVGAALLKVDPEYGGAVSSLALNTNLAALDDVPKLGELAPRLKPVLVDVIGRFAPAARPAYGSRLGPSVKVLLAKYKGNPLVDCYRTLLKFTKPDDAEVWRVTVALMRFDDPDYACQGSSPAESCEEVRRAAVVAFRGLKHPDVGPRPKPPANPNRLTAAELGAQSQWQLRRRQLVAEPVGALVRVVEKDGEVNRREALKTLEEFATGKARAEVVAALGQLSDLSQTPRAVKEDVAPVLRRLGQSKK